MSQSPTPLRLFNSLTRQIEDFEPVHAGEARVYTCGPTVYNYQHIGNMRAYVFADTLGRVLSYKGFKLKHVINITDVGHLTSDADSGDDKMEKAAGALGKSAREIADFYTQAYWEDIDRLNIRQPAKWTIATDYVDQMIAFAKGIADKHCYELESGLYFDTSTVADYGRLARASTEDGQSRIDPVPGKRQPQDFAIWRKTPLGETRQMEWDSPWGKGAPGWHLECSVMSGAELGFQFDIHTGGIDHREIHHPCEIAQNQAHCGVTDSGAQIWMHNNFLIDRAGKMSKSSGDFLRLQALIDKGFHPLAYRLMCLQAHYRSELEFSWENLAAAFTRLKRMIRLFDDLRAQAGSHLAFLQNSGLDLDSILWLGAPVKEEIEHSEIVKLIEQFDVAICYDLNTSEALVIFERLMSLKRADQSQKASAAIIMMGVLGLDIQDLSQDFPTPVSLRIRPKAAVITEAEIKVALSARKEARSAKDFAKSDAIRDDLIAKGVEVMDGDPLGWDWRIDV